MTEDQAETNSHGVKAVRLLLGIVWVSVVVGYGGYLIGKIATAGFDAVPLGWTLTATLLVAAGPWADRRLRVVGAGSSADTA